MPDETLAIVTEYVGDADKRIRCNAITALAIIGTPKAVEHLVDLAVSDADDDVRADAEAALSDLEGSVLEAASGHFEALLNDPSRERDVYSLLGRLRAAGAYARLGLTRQRPLHARLRAAIAGAWRPDGRLRWWTIGVGLLGSVAGALLLTLILRISGIVPNTDATMVLVFLAAPLAMLFAFVCAQCVRPIARYWDRTLGMVAELSLVGLGALVVGGLVSVVPLLVEVGGSLVLVLSALVLFAATAIFVRLGTMIGFGRLIAHRRPTFLRLSVPILSGCAAGLFAVTVATLLLMAMSAEAAVAEWAPEFWLVLLPSILPLAWIFALIDARAPEPEPEPVLGRPGRWANLALLASLSIALTLVISPFEEAAAAAADVEFEVVLDGSTETAPKTLERIPASVKLDVRTPMALTARLPGTLAAGADLELVLYRGRDQLERGDDPPEIRHNLATGHYRLDARYFEGPISVEVASADSSEILEHLVGHVVEPFGGDVQDLDATSTAFSLEIRSGLDRNEKLADRLDVGDITLESGLLVAIKRTSGHENGAGWLPRMEEAIQRGEGRVAGLVSGRNPRLMIEGSDFWWDPRWVVKIIPETAPTDEQTPAEPSVDPDAADGDDPVPPE